MSVRNLHGQAARRGRDIHFPRYHVDTATERQEFVGALRYLLERVLKIMVCSSPSASPSAGSSRAVAAFHSSAPDVRNPYSSGAAGPSTLRSVRRPNYNAPVQTNSPLYPIIGLTGLLQLVAVVEKLRTSQSVEEKGLLCRPVSSPPALERQSCHPLMGDAACPESPTSGVAPQPTAHTSTGHGGPEKGGQTCIATT
jgi:hypothetical protein